jgi:GrpB-like predicted nucleotidyltransferase (UPF0157 family)
VTRRSRATPPIVDYDTAWPERYEAARAEIAAALGDEATEIHHIGSTSVPGLAAKDIIDVLVSLRRLELAPEVVAAMEARGFMDRGEFGIADRRLFSRSDCHVHCFRPGHGQWRTHLLFRDYLRAHPYEAVAYAAEKRRLAQIHADDRRAYTAAKSGIVEELLARGRAVAG